MKANPDPSLPPASAGGRPQTETPAGAGRASRRSWFAKPLFASFLAVLSGLPGAADAAEVQFEGFYRARGRVFHSLSLESTLPNSEGTALGIQHRLWLRPRFVLNDKVALFTEIRGFDNVYWGNQQNPWGDPVTNEAVPAILVDELSAPTSDDGRSALLDFTLWRAWGELNTKAGRFSFGRMPVHWGLGMWQNDGLGPLAEYGDSADRVQWEHLIQDQFFVRLAGAVNASTFVNEADEIYSINGAAAYRSEQVTAGFNLQYRMQPALDLQVFTADLAAEATLGKLDLGTEVLARFGAGNLENGINDATIASFGAVVQAGLDLDPWSIQVEGGFASGDGNASDRKLKEFSFDRDYNISMMLFEQPLPTLASGATAEERSFEVAQTGYGVANALYLRPRIARKLRDDLEIELAWIGARAAKLPTGLAERRRYGMEFDLGATYTPLDHFELIGGFGVLVPGNHFTNYADDTYTEGFDDTAFAGQLSARIHF